MRDADTAARRVVITARAGSSKLCFWVCFCPTLLQCSCSGHGCAQGAPSIVKATRWSLSPDSAKSSRALSSGSWGDFWQKRSENSLVQSPRKVPSTLPAEQPREAHGWWSRGRAFSCWYLPRRAHGGQQEKLLQKTCRCGTSGDGLAGMVLMG